MSKQHTEAIFPIKRRQGFFKLSLHGIMRQSFTHCQTKDILAMGNRLEDERIRRDAFDDFTKLEVLGGAVSMIAFPLAILMFGYLIFTYFIPW